MFFNLSDINLCFLTFNPLGVLILLFYLKLPFFTSNFHFISFYFLIIYFSYSILVFNKTLLLLILSINRLFLIYNFYYKQRS
jgi:hypothetical protein